MSGGAAAASFVHRLLDLTTFGTLSTRSLSLLVQHCSRLRTLDISRCSKISATSADLLQSQLPFLENMHCQFIGGADPTAAAL